MSLYTPTSGSLGVNSDSTPLNQQPIVRVELVKTATIPAACVVQDRPNHVIINNSGSYAFLYNTTSSKGGTAAYAADESKETKWVTGSVSNHGGAGLPIKLDINPLAWRQTDGTITGDTGNVTFVFNAKSIKKSV